MAKDCSQQMHTLVTYFAKDATKGVTDGLLSGEDIEVHQILREKKHVDSYRLLMKALIIFGALARVCVS